MSDDAPISSVPPVTRDQVNAPAPVESTRVARTARVDAQAASTSAQPVEEGVGAGVGPAAMHEELAHPAHTPASVASRALIHDAALHGDAIAAAIERSLGAQPSERAQALAGAAASAGSGQAAEVDLEPGPVTLGDQENDPLAPVHRVPRDSTRREPRPGDQTDAG